MCKLTSERTTTWLSDEDDATLKRWISYLMLPSSPTVFNVTRDVVELYDSGSTHHISPYREPFESLRFA